MEIKKYISLMILGTLSTSCTSVDKFTLAPLPNQSCQVLYYGKNPVKTGKNGESVYGLGNDCPKQFVQFNNAYINVVKDLKIKGNYVTIISNKWGDGFQRKIFIRYEIKPRKAGLQSYNIKIK